MPAWFDSFTDAVASGDQQYLACGTCGEPSLPPREFCPECGSTELTPEALSDRGALLSFTEISVTIPKFHGETPYTVVLVELDDGVVLTGQLRDATAADVSIGDELVLETEPHGDGTALLTFRPAAD
ncbi:Zn-ribbon domain-containing OB-fold protein [Haloarchaeobius sp. HRN-SO-5]|uniref:Zn-ribbon domain-containing OB-fold protein n=1 Tax=Haloarchaeobius sp. HRN-SO-5 TaxID=3446118 RepID=UPI003EB92751